MRTQFARPGVIFASLALAAALAAPVAASYGPATMQDVQVRSLTTGEVIDGSSARIVRNDAFGLVGGKITTSGLPAGHVVVLSWAVFNDPEACTVGNPITGVQCGPGDLANPATGASVQLWAGAVVGPDGNFKAAGGRLALNDLADCYSAPAPPCRDGLTNPAGAEVHLVLRDKGPLIPERFVEQSSTFFGGCDAYACVNPQSAQFLP
jgi:hypothetical protein